MAARAGIPVYTVALGTDRPGWGGDGVASGFGFSRVPTATTLRTISETTGGEYFAARSARALSSAYGDLGSRLGRAERRTEVTSLFVAAAAVALAAASLAALGAGIPLVRRDDERRRRPGPARRPAGPRAVPHAGRMFWFTLKMFSGS